MTLWIGEVLGSVERACLRSILRQGHALSLYCYIKPKGIPAGVKVRDASQILSFEHVFRHRSGSAAIFADWFRYELQRRGLGTWVDTDMYLLAPLNGDREYLFGEQAPGVINNAVFRAPEDSSILGDLLRPFNSRMPPWLPMREKLYQQGHKLLTGKLDPSRFGWGMTGPAALSWAARAHGVADKALPQHVFYPAPWERADWICSPAISLDEVVRPDTVGVHLWNECIKTFKNQPAQEGSFLFRLQQEGELER